MGASFDRLRCEVFQNLFLSPMNTGFVRPAVATVLTVYGIETVKRRSERSERVYIVATVLTVYGIETFLFTQHNFGRQALQQYLPFTVLKPPREAQSWYFITRVATVLTVYGIETYLVL